MMMEVGGFCGGGWWVIIKVGARKHHPLKMGKKKKAKESM